MQGSFVTQRGSGAFGSVYKASLLQEPVRVVSLASKAGMTSSSEVCLHKCLVAFP